MLQVIGKVSATEKMPSTIDNFYFWTDKGQILSPFDIVKVEHVSSNSDKSITYGVIEEITHVTDAASHFTNFIYGHEIEMYTVEQGEKRDKRQ